MEENEQVMISKEEMSEYIYNELIEEGLAPTEEETKILARIFFDFLYDKGAFSYVEDED
jgi:hypothetical protein